MTEVVKDDWVLLLTQVAEAGLFEGGVEAGAETTVVEEAADLIAEDEVVGTDESARGG